MTIDVLMGQTPFSQLIEQYTMQIMNEVYLRLQCTHSCKCSRGSYKIITVIKKYSGMDGLSTLSCKEERSKIQAQNTTVKS